MVMLIDDIKPKSIAFTIIEFVFRLNAVTNKDAIGKTVKYTFPLMNTCCNGIKSNHQLGLVIYKFQQMDKCDEMK